MRVKVDEQTCLASGQCVLAVVEVFDQRDEDGIVVLLEPHPPDDLAHEVRAAAAACPALAITVEE